MDLTRPEPAEGLKSGDLSGRNHPAGPPDLASSPNLVGPPDLAGPRAIGPKVLEIFGVRKSFGGLSALGGVDLEVEAGLVHGLIGPNGAGKTTLFNVMTGLCPPDARTILVCGRRLRPKKIHEATEAGIARTFQNIRLFNSMTALENVMVGLHSKTREGVLAAVLRTPGFKAEERLIKSKSLELLEFVGLGAMALSRADSLAYGHQRRLEIARALASDPKILALDEPAAGMNPHEKASLMELIGSIRDAGRSVLLIEHDVRLVMGVCDHVSVLASGLMIFDGLPEEARRDPAVIEAYLGVPAKPLRACAKTSPAAERPLEAPAPKETRAGPPSASSPKGSSAEGAFPERESSRRESPEGSSP